jgi:hypothetical protein
MLKRKVVFLIIVSIVLLLGVGFLVWMGPEILDIVRPISSGSANSGIKVSTDKQIYSKGEIVGVTIEKVGDKKLYTGVSFAFYENSLLTNESSGLSFYRLKDGVSFSVGTAEERKNWEEISMPPCQCSSQCIDGKIVNLCPMMELLLPACKQIPQGIILEEWPQDECVKETKSCGDRTYKVSVLKQIEAGTYKVRFCFAEESDIDWSKDYCSPKEASLGPGNIKPQCVETIFTIKE